ncbi:coiled-coil domain-containing protein 9 isoform X1 [Electrophorus electricus]|uniref:coiled-coil domain-containing protein 9 isoform X1 n=1 Tax=Electrophorus electricus TaxID=8005 RepID=UPI0015CFC746|nr:coiled-coil domain-containing protein 9 isoform X1 [Electrophorus electricus]
MSAMVDLRTKEEKDAELDRRIEALRKKNEALVRRYQEIEEDKKKAEEEGIAVTTPRKPRSHEPDSERRKTEKENLTVTVDLYKPSGEKRVVNDRKAAPHRSDHGPEEGDSGQLRGESPPRKAGAGRPNRGGQRGGGHRSDRREPRSDKGDPRADRASREGEGGEGPSHSDRPRGGRRGGRAGAQQGGSGSDRKSKEWEEKRRQNIEKMNEEMEKIAEYERGQRADGEKNPTRNFLDDPRRSGPIPEMDRKEGSRRHVRNWGGLDFDNVKTGAEVEKEWTNRRPGAKSSMDMTLSMTGRERAEYLRWKKEREQIDEERLARHRNATGQWRREWDAQKTDTMFPEDPTAAGEGMPEAGSKRAARGRNARIQQRSGASEDSKRPPKVPTFGDFLGQGKPRDGGRGGHGREKGRAQGKSYSMHDNRWEAEKEEEKGKKEEEEKEKKEKPKAPSEKPADTAEKSTISGAAEEDDDQWEDASDGEEEEEEEEEEEVQSEDKKAGVQKDSKPTEKTTSSPAPSTPSPKEQRAPRPKVHIPSPQETLSAPEAAKPLSPFSLLEGHQPVSDWGEEMEMQSPKSSMGESPLKPSSNGTSPVPTKSQEEGRAVDAASQPEEGGKRVPAQPPLEAVAPVKQEEPVLSEPPAPPADPSPETPATEEPQDPAPHKEESATAAVDAKQGQSGSETAADITLESLDQSCSG